MTEINHRSLALLTHPLDAESVFLPETLIRAVRNQRGQENLPLPKVCILDFDGDLTDELERMNELKRCTSWACFHTAMWHLDVDGHPCGIIPRTIGGPYAVLVAEQLAASGVQVIIGLTSSGRVSPTLPVPCVVVADGAVRDEGTSYHYLPPAEMVAAPSMVASALYDEVLSLGLTARRGIVWTTDAPYRETAEQLEMYADREVLAVEMQTASLFAFAERLGVLVGVLAHVTNAIDHEGESFDKGTLEFQRNLLYAACRGGRKAIISRSVPDASGTCSSS